MWPLLAEAQGTYFRGSTPCILDQILVSRGLLTGEAGMKINTASAEVVYCPSMMTKNNTPRRFGRPSSTLDIDGASDHLPVGVIVTG